jgi:hypothetical protein
MSGGAIHTCRCPAVVSNLQDYITIHQLLASPGQDGQCGSLLVCMLGLITGQLYGSMYSHTSDPAKLEMLKRHDVGCLRLF